MSKDNIEPAIFIADFAGKCIREKVMMEKPDTKFWRGDQEDFRRVWENNEKYKAHVASRRSYPYPVKEEQDGKELILDKDFKLEADFPGGYTFHAIPIEPETKIKSMIEAKDLRIGNWIQCDIWENGELFYLKVKAVANDSVFVDNHSGNFGGYDGIPLTPEILKEIGFNFYPSTSSKGLMTYKFSSLGGYLQAGPYEDHWYVEYVNDGKSFSKLCHYLHELQNLYHSLTGNEIEYKP